MRFYKAQISTGLKRLLERTVQAREGAEFIHRRVE